MGCQPSKLLIETNKTVASTVAVFFGDRRLIFADLRVVPRLVAPQTTRALDIAPMCSKHYRYAKPCPYGTGLKTWLVAVMQHVILWINGAFSGLTVQSNPNDP
jgi:hypothetical protein